MTKITKLEAQEILREFSSQLSVDDKNLDSLIEVSDKVSAPLAPYLLAKAFYELYRQDELTLMGNPEWARLFTDESRNLLTCTTIANYDPEFIAQGLIIKLAVNDIEPYKLYPILLAISNGTHRSMAIDLIIKWRAQGLLTAENYNALVAAQTPANFMSIIFAARQLDLAELLTSSDILQKLIEAGEGCTELASIMIQETLPGNSRLGFR